MRIWPIYQVALNLFQSEGERRGCYYFTIWKRRYLSSPVQIYNNWFVKIPVAISQQHRKSQRTDCSLLHGLCNVPVYSGDTRAVWTHMTFIYGREHNFLQSLSDTEKTTSSFTPFCIKNRKLLTIVFGRRPASFDGNQNGKSHAKWGHAEWTLNPLFTQNGKIIPLMCNSFNASSAKITRRKKKKPKILSTLETMNRSEKICFTDWFCFFLNESKIATTSSASNFLQSLHVH